MALYSQAFLSALQAMKGIFLGNLGIFLKIFYEENSKLIKYKIKKVLYTKITQSTNYRNQELQKIINTNNKKYRKVL